jgi:hypothetical protein
LQALRFAPALRLAAFLRRRRATTDTGEQLRSSLSARPASAIARTRASSGDALRRVIGFPGAAHHDSHACGFSSAAPTGWLVIVRRKKLSAHTTPMPTR